MCLILFSWQQYGDHPLILAANRDERYDRPTDPLHWWQEPAEIVGGRDRQAGGSWLAINRQGRFAAVTNVRDSSSVPEHMRSRGSLITDYLTSHYSLDDWLAELRSYRNNYCGFNLLVGDITTRRLAFYSNQSDRLTELAPGLYGLANGALDESWPKVERGKSLLASSLNKSAQPDVSDLLSLLADCHQPNDVLLPDTGIGVAAERLLAPITIRSELYGTCSSSVLITHTDGKMKLYEQDRRPQTSATLLSESCVIVAG